MPVTDPNFNPSGSDTIKTLKEEANYFASLIERLPEGRRRSLALTYLETASMYAVKAAAVGDE